jgi:radical SAM protein with 4Fe4S-binding SPASM domain
MTVPTPLSSELTAMVNRNRFEWVPGGVDDPADHDRWRAFRAAYHRAQDLDGPEDFPLQLDVELTSQCNLRCTFCVHGQGEVAYRALNRPAFDRILDEAQDHGLVSMKFNYINEPLLVPDLPDYLRAAKDHGVLNTYFATNGVLLNERTRAGLIDARTSKIMISIDAATSETYLRMRRSKHYDRVVANIHALLEDRERLGITYPLVRVNFLKTAENVDEIETFIRMWDGVADAIGFQDQVALPGVADNVLRDAANADESTFRCSFPSKQLVVDAAGHILPCCTFSGREMPLGHIDEISLADAWRSRKMLELQRSHRENTWRDNPVCRQCIYGDAPEATTAATDATLIQLDARG